MPYKLRFVQKIDQAKKDEFLEIERAFMELEKNNPHMPQGTRFLPVSGKESANTLIWECVFDTMSELTSQLTAIYENPDHDALLKKQVPFMRDNYTEIYELFE